MGRKFKIKKGLYQYSPDKLLESFKASQTVGDATLGHEISCTDEDKRGDATVDQFEQEVVDINLKNEMRGT